MDSFGVRFNEEKYIKVDIDFDSGDNVVTIVVDQDGTPVTATGVIAWNEGE